MADTHSRRLLPLSLAALGVVFGDIGTSPLYAFKLCFTGDFTAAVTPQNVYGILSLIFWSIVVVVCVKYVAFMLRADNDGQGGTIALLALLAPKRKGAMPLTLGGLAIMVLIGECMLYGDGAITPAISVISALEGLDVWTKAAHSLIVPLAVIVLVALFYMQKRGTDRIGKFFGPVMILWFATLAVCGIRGIAMHPAIIAALNPAYALEFFLHHGFGALLIFGAVVLCITGVEALYADLGHFGRKPITLAWYAAVFPSLVLNYLGQGAVTLADGGKIESPFFALVPSWAIVPMVLLATAATVIASQALISGVFSLSSQMMQLGFSPRFRIVHTSRHHAGQIYIPTINAVLAIACILLVLAFRSSSAFGGAYGLAVTITMIISTLTFYFFLRRRWKWPVWASAALIGFWLCWDVPFLIGNLWKILSGGWVPLLMAGSIFTLFLTWNRGRRRMMARLSTQTMSVEQFLAQAHESPTISGTAVFLTPDQEGIPFVMRHQWLREHIMFDTVILLTIVNMPRPYVHPDNRVRVDQLAPQLYRVRAYYGFMQQSEINDILKRINAVAPELHTKNATYYLASPKIAANHGPGTLPDWQRSLYRWMIRNARPLTDSLGLPPNRIVEFGVEVPI